MAEARCTDCDHRWETDDPAEEIREAPCCPNCGGRSIDVRDESGWFRVWR